MKDARLRISVDDDYVAALGVATYAFAYMEWAAVWCCERIAPGSIEEISEKTAGKIAEKFVVLAGGLSPSNDRDLLQAEAAQFKALVKVRNGIMHGKPGTDTNDNDAQRLFRDGVPWTVETLNKAADDFSECSVKLNGFLYGFLSA